jgi:prepilin signal peptidase PulO-like enzyme (type II secretory pathway)
VLAAVRLGTGWRWLSLLPLLATLAVIVVLDFRSQVIPDLLSLPGLAYALLVAAAVPDRPSLSQAALGAMVGGGVVLLLAIVSRGAVGGGDIKLMAMLGAALGPWPALVALACAHIAGGLIAVALLVSRRANRKTPLSIGALIALFGALLLARGGELFSVTGASG